MRVDLCAFRLRVCVLSFFHYLDYCYTVESDDILMGLITLFDLDTVKTGSTITSAVIVELTVLH